MSRSRSAVTLLAAGAVLALPTLPIPLSAQSTPTILTQALRDFDGNGARDTLSIVMSEGELLNDEEPWCGGGEKLRGDFEIRVSMDDGSTTTHPLRTYSFFRPGEWSISFGDYNHDGRSDFNLGQYGSCDGWRYELFTVDSMGEIRELQTSRSSLPVAAFTNSTPAITVIEGGFEHCYYDPRFGHLVERYRWNEEMEVFFSDGERPVEDCP